MPSMARGVVGIRGYSSSGRAGKIGTSPIAASTLSSGGRRNQLRAKLRGKNIHPARHPRGGVMPVEAKHSQIPEAKVRFPTIERTAATFFPRVRGENNNLSRCLHVPKPFLSSSRSSCLFLSPPTN